MADTLYQGFPKLAILYLMSIMYQVIVYLQLFSMINPIIVLRPSLAEASLVEYDDLHRAVLRELVYGLCRSNVLIQNTNIPQWMVFHSALCDTELTTTGVAFNPIIMATPTNYSTVYTTMLRVQEVGKELGFEHLPLFFYMGLLTKALEIQWANPDSLSGVALGDGGMHLIMSLFSDIGCLYEDAGLKNILIDSNVFAAGTVQQIMKGKDFDRALESYKMLEEVLLKRFFIQFNVWCEEKSFDVSHFTTELESLDIAFSLYLQKTNTIPNMIGRLEHIEELLNINILPLIEQFRSEGCQTSPTFNFGMIFCFMF